MSVADTSDANVGATTYSVSASDSLAVTDTITATLAPPPASTKVRRYKIAEPIEEGEAAGVDVLDLIENANQSRANYRPRGFKTKHEA